MTTTDTVRTKDWNKERWLQDRYRNVIATLQAAFTLGAFAATAIAVVLAYGYAQRDELVARTTNCMELATHHNSHGDTGWGAYAATKGRALLLCLTPTALQRPQGGESLPSCVQRMDKLDIDSDLSPPDNAVTDHAERPTDLGLDVIC